MILINGQEFRNAGEIGRVAADENTDLDVTDSILPRKSCIAAQRIVAR